jgi:hypothetical protein
MNARLIFTVIFSCLVSTAVMAQATGQQLNRLVKVQTKKDSLGLKRIYRSWDEDDEERLERDLAHLDVTIQAAVDRVDLALRNMDIPPVDVEIPEIEIPAMDMEDIHIPEINIPEFDIRIPDIDVDIDHDRFDFDRDHHSDTEGIKDKDQSGKDKQKDKEKKKGLVKIR